MRVHVRASAHTFLAGGFALAGAFLGAGLIASYLTGWTRPLQAASAASAEQSRESGTRSSEKRAAVAPASSQAQNPVPGHNVTIASPGRIEARSDTVEVGAAVDGVIETIYVSEGQPVAKGQILAELDCRELTSALPVAKSESESLRQVRARLLVGSRTEERQAAEQRTARALAVLSHAKVELERQRQLVEAKVAAQVMFDEARREVEVAESEYQVALRSEALVNADPVTEDLAKADADLVAANQRVVIAEERQAKCVIHAPIAGTVLRVLLHRGESFALSAPRPILTLADLTGRRVRAEVDEKDVGKVRLGQTVTISSEAFSGERFTGRVTRIAALMGRKSIITGDPADKTDRDVLEVTAELEPGAVRLPVGLRCTVYFGS